MALSQEKMRREREEAANATHHRKMDTLTTQLVETSTIAEERQQQIEQLKLENSQLQAKNEAVDTQKRTLTLQLASIKAEMDRIIKDRSILRRAVTRQQKRHRVQLQRLIDEKHLPLILPPLPTTVQLEDETASNESDTQKDIEEIVTEFQRTKSITLEQQSKAPLTDNEGGESATAMLTRKVILRKRQRSSTQSPAKRPDFNQILHISSDEEEELLYGQSNEEDKHLEKRKVTLRSAFKK
jgi:hypothetical protein